MKKIVLMLAAMALVAGIAQAELLTNPGFEDGAYGVKLIPDGWSIYSPTYSSGWDWWLSGGGAHGGSKYMSMHAAPSASYTTATIGQVLPAAPGDEFTFSVWAKSPSQSVNATPYGYITWGNATTSWLSYGSLIPDNSSVGNTWTLVSFDAVTAPAGAEWGYFQVMGTLANDAAAGGILYDDASLIPEPVTLGLLGLGALMLRRRK